MRKGFPEFRLSRPLKVVIQAALTLLVTWFIVKGVAPAWSEVEAVRTSGWTLSGGWVAASLGLLLLAYLYSAALWGWMVRELGGPEVGVLASVRLFFTANLGRYLPGKVWPLVGVAALAQREGVRPSTATLAALLGQAFSLGGSLLVGGALLGAGAGIPWLGGVGWWGWIGVGLFLLTLTYPPLLGWLTSWGLRLFKAPALKGFRPDPAFGIRWTTLYALSWALQGLAFWVLAQGMGLPLPVLGGVGAYALAYLLGYLAVFAPAGLGVREGFLIRFLEPTLGMHAWALALVARLWATAAELLPAAVLAGGYWRAEPGRGKGGG